MCRATASCEVVRDQFLTLRLDERRAIDSIPKLLPPDPERREQMMDAIRRVVMAQGTVSREVTRRLAHVAYLFTAQPALEGTAA